MFGGDLCPGIGRPEVLGFFHDQNGIFSEVFGQDKGDPEIAVPIFLDEEGAPWLRFRLESIESENVLQ